MATQTYVNRVLMTSQFFRGFKQLQKQRRFTDIDEVKKVIDKLVKLESVDSYGPHPLNASRDITELHVKPDVLLLYRYEGSLLKLDLYLEGLTNHDDLNRVAKLPCNVKYVKSINSDSDVDNVMEDMEKLAYFEMDL